MNLTEININMKGFWIVFGITIIAFLLAGHGILKVWNKQVDVQLYEAQTKRLETIDYACQYVEKGRDLAFIIDGQTIKCSEVRINYVPSQEKVRML